jgi:hypothetical protein
MFFLSFLSQKGIIKLKANFEKEKHATSLHKFDSVAKFVAKFREKVHLHYSKFRFKLNGPILMVYLGE